MEVTIMVPVIIELMPLVGVWMLTERHIVSTSR